MKDKFDKAIRKSFSKATGISSAIEKSAIACNTLHQQALKEEREKREAKRNNISEKLNDIANELHFAGHTLLEGQLKRIAEEL